MTWTDPCLRRCRTASGDLVVLGVPQLDTYLEFLAARSRPNTVLAVAYDLKVFFTVVGKPPERVVAADVLGSSPLSVPVPTSAGCSWWATLSLSRMSLLGS